MEDGVQCVVLRVRLVLSIRYSSLAQSVEHAAVNRSVVGSSPTGGVQGHEEHFVYAHNTAPWSSG